MTLEEFHATLKNQGVAREDFAFRCPICKTVQSGRSLMRAGAGARFHEVERFLGFSCVGRFTNAPPHRDGNAAGRGCDWTLGGLFKLHALEVVTPDGEKRPFFEPVTAEEAQALARQHDAEEAA